MHLKALIWTAITLASILPMAVQSVCAAPQTVQTADDGTSTNADAYTPNTQIPAYTDCSVNLVGSSDISANTDNITNGNFQRWYFIDAQTGEMVKNSAQFMEWTTTNWAAKGCFYRSEYGLCVYPRSTASSIPGDVRLSLPTGYKSWSEVKLVILAASSTNGVTAENMSPVNQLYPNFKVTSDPTTWTAAYLYTLSIEYPKFQPYEGVVCAAGDFEVSQLTGAKRQHTHSWSYDFYVAPGSTVEIKAPIVDNEYIEYGSYWRWYDNNTFKANPRLSTDSKHGASLRDKFRDEENRSEGLFYTSNSTGATRTQWATSASVLYQVPTDASWTGDDIAADASRYIDGDGYNSSVAFREPTLSTRFIWHLHPNTEIANNIKQAIINGNAYEDHGNITIALHTKTSSAYSTLRLDLHDVGQYWCYPYRMDNYGKPATELDFNSQMIQPKSMSWAVHVRVGDKLYYKFLGEGSRFNTSIRYNLYAKDVLGKYTDVDNAANTITLDTLKTGFEYVIIVYANSLDYSSTSNLTSPVARFNCYFITQVQPQKADGVSSHRTIERLEANYTRVGLINFDDETGMTFDSPTQIYTEGATTNNSWHHPIDWDKAYYGFVYPQLIAAGKSTIGYNNFGKYGAFHGDYMLVKQAGGTESPSGGNGNAYRWWYYGTKNYNVLHDRTYELTNGQRSGHFLYVDASDEARPIASLDFEANLCSGSTLILSAAVADLTSGNERPQLLLKLYGVKYDEDHHEVSRQLIQSFASGDFLSHIQSDAEGNATVDVEKAVWYQIFARTFIHPNASADQYSHFIVTIDNNCKSTGGADYAIDDIRFYVANDQVEVLQQADKEDLCERKDNGAYLKLRMDYSMIHTFVQANERRKPLYYRICTNDGKPVNSANLKYDNTAPSHEELEITDADGTTYKCGRIWIEPTEDENRSNLEENVYGFSRLVVANAFFELDPTKEYYVSCALPIETENRDGTFSYTPGYWGNPGTPCSIYSKIINIKQQDFVITSGNGQTTSKYYADCGEEEVTVNLTAKLSIPDALYGGRKEIDWKFDWVIGGEEAFNKDYIHDGLLDVIQHFRAEYPDAPTWDWDFMGAFDAGVIGLDENWDYYIAEPDNLYKFGSTPPKGVYTVYDALFASITDADGSADTFDNSITQLFLRASGSMSHIIHIPAQGTIYTNIYYIPVPGIYTDPETGVKYRICADPIKGSLELSHLTPQLYLGYPSVTYPDEYERSAKYIRLGLKQANELKKGTPLSIPINGYRDASLEEGANRNNLAIEEDNGENVAYPCVVRLVDTNDPTVKDEQKAWFGTSGVATRYHNGKAAMVIPDDRIITPDSKTISIDFSQNTEDYSDGTSFTNDITFHEGYDYRFVITYHDASKQIGADNATAICYAYTFFTLRIIPEYVTWTGAVPANTNWNNDLNWRRASRSELSLPYEKQKSATSNSAVSEPTEGGAPNNSELSRNYLDYGCEELAAQDQAGLQQYPDANQPESTPQAFVPMKFTKVIINPGTSFPYLGSYEVDGRQGIITNLQNPNLSEGSSLIAYDLMVQTEKNASNAYD